MAAQGRLAFGFLTLFVYGLLMPMFFHLLHALPVAVMQASTDLVPVFAVVIAMLLLGKRLEISAAEAEALLVAACRARAVAIDFALGLLTLSSQKAGS
jgi:drug/metabolite transporter (DMT)-like permease